MIFVHVVSSDIIIQLVCPLHIILCILTCMVLVLASKFKRKLISDNP